VKLMRRVGWNIDGRASAHYLLCTAKNKVEFAFQQRECLFEIVTMRRRSASGRDVHVDEAEASCRVFAGEKNGVGIAYHSYVRAVRVGVSLGDGEVALQIVRGNCCDGLSGWI